MKKLFLVSIMALISLSAEIYISPKRLVQNALTLSEPSETLVNAFMKTGQLVDTPANKRAALTGFFIYLGKCTENESQYHEKNKEKLIAFFEIIDSYFQHDPSFMKSDLCLFLFPLLADCSPETRPSIIELLNNVDNVLNKKSDLMESYATVFLDHQDAAPHDLLTLLHGEEGSGSFLKNQESRWLIEIGYCVAAGVLLEKLDNAIIGEFVLFNDMLSLYQTDPNEEIFNKFFTAPQ